jgi:hypothetical protein
VFTRSRIQKKKKRAKKKGVHVKVLRGCELKRSLSLSLSLSSVVDRRVVL